MKGKLVPLILMFFFGAILPITPTMSQTQPTIYVNPPNIIDPSLVIDSTFTVNISLRDVLTEHDLVGVEFKLYWDPSILEGMTIVLPPGHMFQAAQDDDNLWVIKKTIDKTAGIAWYLVTCSDLNRGYEQGYLPLVGDGVLATITFKVKALGSTPLELGVHKLSNGLGNPISHNVEDGYFRNTPLPPPAEVYILPRSIKNVSLTPSSTFKINVTIINATDLNSFEFTLSFNNTILNAINVTLGDFFPPESTLIPTPWINNAEGWVHFGANMPEDQSKSGNGTLATIQFNVTGLGATPLELINLQLLNLYGEELPYTVYNSTFNNVLLATMYVNPPEIIDPALVPPATFQVNINLYDIENMYGYELNLTFNTAVLTCLSAVVHDVLNETNYSVDYAISNTKGYLWVKVNYYPPAIPITSYENITLVTVTFRVKALGVSVLDLHSTQITDPEDQDIPHEAEDGIFISLIRDVAVLNVVSEVNSAYQGWVIQINVTVANEGNITESFVVNTYYDGNLIEGVTVNDLEPGENITLIYEWNTENVEACRNYTISAEAVAVPYEIDLSDNFLDECYVKIKLMGDINGDGQVNVFDAVLLSEAAGSWEGHPRWNADADFDRNNFIDLFDAVVLSKNAGKSCQ